MSLSAVLSNSTLLRLSLGGWAFFIAENTLLSHNRTYLISDIFNNNEKYYHAAYGTCSTVATGLIIHGYRSVRNVAPFFKTPKSPAALGAAFVLQAVGLAGLSQLAPKMQIPVAYNGGGAPATTAGDVSSPIKSPSVAKAPASVWQVRCPFDFKTSQHDAVQGVGRVSRHSSLWSFAAFSVGTAATVASVPQAMCLAAPVAVAVIGGAHQDYRFRRGMGGSLPPDLDARTSNIPFAAMLSGGQGSVPEAFQGLFSELKGLNAGAAVLVAAGLALRRGRGL